jgi:uncharacterized protein YcbX
MNMTTVKITSVLVYPVKSMRGISLDGAVLTRKGLACDRAWMVVRKDGRFVTQRDLPRMALIGTAIDDGGVTLSRKGYGSIEIPFDAPAGPTVRTRVWKDECKTLELGQEISQWLTAALESPEQLRLVRMAPGFIRPQGQPENLGTGTTTRFADAAPYLVASENSLARLNRELEARGHKPVPMNRFRPNIVIRGLDAFAEHRVKALETNAFRLDFRHPCQRCVVTTIDQATAETDPDGQPFKTLVRLNPMPGDERAPAFAHNAVLGWSRAEGQRVGCGDTPRVRFD